MYLGNKRQKVSIWCQDDYEIVNNDLLVKENPASENLEEEMIKWHKEHFGNKRDWEKTSGEYLTRKSQLDIAHHFAEWQKEKDYKMYAHVPLKDIHDAWQELKKNKPDIENYPAVCFQKGADWRENHMKETLQTEYEKGRFDMRVEMMKDALDGYVSLIVKSDTSSRNLFISTPQLYKELQKYEDGDKVKIVVLKTE